MFFQTGLLLSLSLWTKVAYAAFGITTSSSSYVIDAGSANPLKFTVSRSSCDITSINYSGTELQYASKGSHISSGLGRATVSATQDGDYIKVTCATSTLTHYMVVHHGDSTIHMATHITAEPSIGELRFIARLKSDVLPNEEPFGDVSTTAGGTAIEGSDVFLVNGKTRSKFYSSQRFIDDQRHCISGSAHRVCMILNQYESSSGGPFHRDIDANNGGGFNALYWYMNSGHVQTEPYRMGLHGPYSMVFSRSGMPGTNIDTSFFANLNIKGYVPASGRGTVTGKASGADSRMKWVVHWHNTAAQYWTYTASDGSFTSPAMKPGTYTMVYYQGEYKVAETSVTVRAGSKITKNISGSVKTGKTIFKIGEWDGQPTGFRNADKQLRMHPSDSRMAAWGPLTYTVGRSAPSDFPMAVFKSVNNPVTIKFTASAAQTAAATLRIGTTLSFAGGRPQAKINSYTAAAPPAPKNLDSRGVTRGAYRGLGEVYDVAIPAGTIVAGVNTITISVVSGNSGEKFLSPNFVFDCVELFQ
ncbi:putative rhamnogalacturonase B [Aspergillus clavatus NRRL 1]|uniref:Probable rhamnogalacturonate lyase A n=1 Tax=Aspergillus clavatus (strain ATCC 1007 / CBS 513.65 / DSM 816 / NCTC 3887 / NRRL 1 / QM 1276 / 107) TaxID=344612 RepID=RGLA_ASPCL|nr:rhamnogalacturonase B, putative [Aspergillus clavatus NRRL 1]A1C995.1 RecName: Full=Probable rhamnogalacturonate lyase A; Flags: Precursor [Aspergillus clavatus NRRL 1]EAW13419.1 rhamnogalacturonase B, putative [Aspergillus clavatus NRRL 1]